MSVTPRNPVPPPEALQRLSAWLGESTSKKRPPCPVSCTISSPCLFFRRLTFALTTPVVVKAAPPATLFAIASCICTVQVKRFQGDGRFLVCHDANTPEVLERFKSFANMLSEPT